MRATIKRADPEQYQVEKKKRAAARKQRNRKLRDDALKDKRRQKTYARLWIAYVRAARDRSDRGRLITVAELCRRASVSEASFHKNLTGRTRRGTELPGPSDGGLDETYLRTDTLAGIFVLTLAVVDRISDTVMREVIREVTRREETGERIDRSTRLALTIIRLVEHITRYPRLFQVDGIMPREVIYSVSDVLAEAIIWTDPATLQSKAEAAASAKYHAAALIGIMRSTLGVEADDDIYTDRIIYRMASQILPAQTADHHDFVVNSLGKATELPYPAELDIQGAHGYQRLDRILDHSRMKSALGQRQPR